MVTHSRLSPWRRLSLRSTVHIFPFIVLDVLSAFYGRQRNVAKRMDHVQLTPLVPNPLALVGFRERVEVTRTVYLIHF